MTTMMMTMVKERFCYYIYLKYFKTDGKIKFFFYFKHYLVPTVIKYLVSFEQLFFYFQLEINFYFSEEKKTIKLNSNQVLNKNVWKSFKHNGALSQKKFEYRTKYRI